MDKFCSKCGTRLKEQDLFCEKCGTKVVNEIINTDFEKKTVCEHGVMKFLQEHPWKSSAITIVAVVLLGICIGVVFSIPEILEGSTRKSSNALIRKDIKPHDDILGFMSSFNDCMRSTVTTSNSSYHANDEEYISAAKTLMDKNLKNPSTATYNSASVVERDSYGRGIILLDVSSQNGFGGWVREEYYVCITGFQSENYFEYNNIFCYGTDLEFLKLVNEFGVNPKDKELEGYLMEETDIVDLGNHIYNSEIRVYQYYFDNTMLEIYVDNRDNLVHSVMVKSNSYDLNEVICAAISALGDISFNETIEFLTSLNTTEKTNKIEKYEKGILYERCFETDGYYTIATIVAQEDYRKKDYWTPLSLNVKNEIFESDNNPDNHNTLSHIGDWKAEYDKVLDNIIIEFPDYQYWRHYTLYDIDENGTPEMFVKVGTCEADYEFRVFTMSEDTYDVKLIETLPAGHTSVCGIQTKGAFLLHGAHQGYEWIYKVTMVNNNLVQEVIFDAEVVNYHELESLSFYEASDRTGLNWSANPSENNQQILDNYTMEDNIIPEPDITSDNFEQVVTLTKRNNWYDNGIFSSYFDSCNYQGNVTWKYIGTTPDIFGLSYYDYTEVDVYRVDHADGWVSYLFVPYNENIGNPPVVFLFFDSSEVPWEIWNGSN